MNKVNLFQFLQSKQLIVNHTFNKVIISCRTHQTSAWQHKHLSTRAFRHITKSSSAAGHTRRWLGNTSTCQHVRSTYKNVIIICRNTRVAKPNYNTKTIHHHHHHHHHRDGFKCFPRGKMYQQEISK